MCRVFPSFLLYSRSQQRSSAISAWNGQRRAVRARTEWVTRNARIERAYICSYDVCMCVWCKVVCVCERERAGTSKRTRRGNDTGQHARRSSSKPAGTDYGRFASMRRANRASYASAAKPRGPTHTRDKTRAAKEGERERDLFFLGELGLHFLPSEWKYMIEHWGEERRNVSVQHWCT